MFEVLHTTHVHYAFSNMKLALRIYLSLVVTNCSGERSLSQVKRVRDVQLAMVQKRLGLLALLHIESDLLNKTDFSNLSEEFAVAKVDKFHSGNYDLRVVKSAVKIGSTEFSK